MNKTEYLLTCLSEECAEVQQSVSKALRFGLDDGNPREITTNAQDIAKECTDIVAIVEILEEEGIIERVGIEQDIIKKKKKVETYMQYSRQRGTLKDEVKNNGLQNTSTDGTISSNA